MNNGFTLWVKLHLPRQYWSRGRVWGFGTFHLFRVVLGLKGVRVRVCLRHFNALLRFGSLCSIAISRLKFVRFQP